MQRTRQSIPALPLWTLPAVPCGMVPPIGTTYSWNFGDGNNGSGASVSHTYPNPGSYNVTLTVTTAAGCVSSVTNTNYIFVYAAPIAGFSSSPNPASSTSPEVTFSDMSSWCY